MNLHRCAFGKLLHGRYRPDKIPDQVIVVPDHQRTLPYRRLKLCPRRTPQFSTFFQRLADARAIGPIEIVEDHNAAGHHPRYEPFDTGLDRQVEVCINMDEGEACIIADRPYAFWEQTFDKFDARIVDESSDGLHMRVCEFAGLVNLYLAMVCRRQSFESVKPV